MAKSVEEIARATGVSVTTVRFVIAGQAERYRISLQTRERVERYIDQHGYVLNYAARALKRRRSESVGFVVPDLANPFFARIVAHIEACCRARDLVLLAVASHEDPLLESRAVSALLARNVDGLILAPCQPELPEMLRMAKRLPRLALFDRDYDHLGVSTVLSDNWQGGEILTRRVLTEAPKNSVFFCGHSESPTIQARVRAYAEVCRRFGRADLAAEIRAHPADTPEAGRQLMAEYLRGHGRPPHAVLCSSLPLLEGVFQSLKNDAGGIDSSLVIGTFDDHTMLDLLPNRVFSIRQDEALLAEQVFTALALDAPTPSIAERIFIPCQLIERNTG